MTVATSIAPPADQRRIALERDFQRDVWCVMGLPFDATTEEATYHHLLNCIETRQRCFLTTPNLNFVVAAQSDPAFRKTVIDSDWVIADGMPIIWAAKALGIPLTERVAGSSVFDRLRNEYRQHDRPLRVVFFGGPDGVAAEAFKKIATDDSAMEVVGFYSPGFGTIEQMSPQHVIDEINESEPDIVLVALGAKRGQQWINYNQHRLTVPVISHLGAVVNFVAGTVARAPDWMQRTGLEWVWRIWEERSLFKRYWSDGLAFLEMYLRFVRPHSKMLEQRPAQMRLTIKSTSGTTGRIVELEGDLTLTELSKARAPLIDALESETDITLDLKKVAFIDNAGIGLLMLGAKAANDYQIDLKIVGASAYISRIFKLNQASYLLS